MNPQKPKQVTTHRVEVDRISYAELQEQLDAITIPGTGFPLGFWMAQQGSILVFVLIIWGYARKMRALDRDAGVEEDDQ